MTGSSISILLISIGGKSELGDVGSFGEETVSRRCLGETAGADGDLNWQELLNHEQDH